MANTDSERKQNLDGFSLMIGALIAVVVQSVYDTFEEFYQINYTILGPYFPPIWAGVIVSLFLMLIYGIQRDRLRRRVSTSS